ncbi:hypothetical protein HAX54_029990, partial [Datura stramonium]|nr:hypothetical protein [Datura stramonium]
MAGNNRVQRRLVVHGEEEEEGEAAVIVVGRREGNDGGRDLFAGEREDHEGKRVCGWFFGGYLSKMMEGEEDEAELVVWLLILAEKGDREERRVRGEGVAIEAVVCLAVERREATVNGGHGDG